MRVIQRPAVVLLHSSGSTARQWQPLVETLQQRFRALPVELHGHGARPAWDADSPMQLADDAALVEPLLQRLGGAHLVGHSYGGAVALKVATLHPHLVKSVAVYEPVLFRAILDDPMSLAEKQELGPVVEWMRLCVARGDLAQAAQRFVEFWSGADAWRYLPPSRQEAITQRMPSVLRHFDMLYDEPFRPEELSRLGIPMLILTGSATVRVARRIGQLLRLALPEATVELIPGLGHMGPITHASVVNARLEQFLVATEANARHTQTLAGRPRMPAAGAY